MDERADILRNLHQLVELDRAFGVEFAPLPLAAPATAVAAAAADNARPAPTGLRPPVGRAATVPAVHAPPTPVPAAPLAMPPGTAPVAAPDLLAQPPAQALAAIAARIAVCQACKLCPTRTTTVPGEGSAQPEILFIGEGPGADEDAAGRPFVGAAGQLLTKMIVAMGLRREDVFIANVIKCRPPGNRTPEPDEVGACLGYLRAQIAILKPKVICTLGNTPLRALTGDESLGITRWRGKRLDFHGIPLIPTFHPSYLLRNEAGKKPCWEDLKAVLAVIGRTPPARA